MGWQVWGMLRLKVVFLKRCCERCDLESARSLPRLPKVISRLHSHPRLRRRPKRLRQPDRHLRRHRRLLLHQFRQRLPAHPQPFRSLRNGKPKHLQALTPHHPTRTPRPNHPHPPTPRNPTDQPSHPHRPHTHPGTQRPHTTPHPAAAVLHPRLGERQMLSAAIGEGLFRARRSAPATPAAALPCRAAASSPSTRGRGLG